MDRKALMDDVVDGIRRLLGLSNRDSRQPHPQRSSLDEYRRAVEIGRADGELNSAERARLDRLASELAISEDEVAQIEREVMTSALPLLLTEPTPTPDHENPLDNKPWVDLAEGCVELVDELDRQMDHFDPPRKELADHVMLRLEEVLQRSGVEVISEDSAFDRRRHKPANAGTQITPGTIITETLSPGFAIGPRVLRRARVHIEGEPLM